MRILVTGGAGFVGSNLARKLEKDGHQVTVLDNFSSGSFHNLVGFHGDVIAADIGDDPPCPPCDAIFHEASITDTTVTDQLKMMRNNVEGFRHVLHWAARWNARVIWASSASVYGNLPAPNKISDTPNPLNVYGYSKLAMERLAHLWAQEHNMRPIIGLRYFNVYGPGEAHKGKFASMIFQLAQQMKAGKRPRIFTDGQQKRDFVSIEDVVQANLLALHIDHPPLASVFNVGCGVPHTFNQVIAALNAALCTKLEPDYFENPYSFTQDHTEADLSDSQKVLGYTPKHTDIVDGINAYKKSGRLWFG
ncbi:MAG: NAD-dependent epimerase/dehydratase family protein [Phycisphaerales bacterium]|nr:NAD-dependent epimerase/dehydratase family protein [Phycisphaerales bacterium]